MIYWHLIVNVVCGKKARQVWYIGNKCIYAEANPLTHTVYNDMFAIAHLLSRRIVTTPSIAKQGVCIPSSLIFWSLFPTFLNCLPFLYLKIWTQKVLTFCQHPTTFHQQKSRKFSAWQTSLLKCWQTFDYHSASITYGFFLLAVHTIRHHMACILYETLQSLQDFLSSL